MYRVRFPHEGRAHAACTVSVSRRGARPCGMYRVRLPQRGTPMRHVPCPSPVEGRAHAACTVSVSPVGGASMQHVPCPSPAEGHAHAACTVSASGGGARPFSMYRVPLSQGARPCSMYRVRLPQGGTPYGPLWASRYGVSDADCRGNSLRVHDDTRGCRTPSGPFPAEDYPRRRKRCRGRHRSTQRCSVFPPKGLRPWRSTCCVVAKKCRR